MIKHGVLWSWDVGNCCYVDGFMMYSEEGVNQGYGVVGSRVLEMLMIHLCYSHYGATV